MPRLVGKRANNSSAIAWVILAAVIIGAVGAEYYGYINVIPGYGREQPSRLENY